MVNVSAISNMAMNILTFVISMIVIVGIAVGGFFGLRYMKRWSQFKVRVWGEDGFGQIQETTDKAGIFVDPKTKNKRFWLKNGNVGLNPDNVPVVRVNNEKIVYVRRYGLKNFRFMTPKVIDDKGEMIVGDEDVNWAINAYDREKKKFISQTLLQYMPFIIIGFVSICILIMIIWVLKQFDVLKDVAIALQTASSNLSGGNIIK